ncbi:MAG: hypothetical protein ABI837_13575 [Acidobacteriota bacterium]
MKQPTSTSIEAFDAPAVKVAIETFDANGIGTEPNGISRSLDNLRLSPVFATLFRG